MTIFQKIKKFATRSFDRKMGQLVDSIINGSCISMIDIGAADGASYRWSNIHKYIDYFAVEPDSRSVASILEPISNVKYHSQHLTTKALWHSPGSITLNLCRKPMTSSIYSPNRDFLNLFPDPERTDVIDEMLLPCVTLDNIADEAKSKFDVIKIDVQGAELDILLGGKDCVRGALAIEVEVEFTELYERQPLFDRIFSALREQKFEFMDFLFVYRWSPDQLNGIGQATFADALFMKTPELICQTGSIEEIKKYAIICCTYERGDLLLRIAKALESSQLQQAIKNEILELGKLVSIRNARTQRQLNFASKLIRILHPGLRAHAMH